MTRRLLLSYLSITAFVLLILEIPLALTYEHSERDRLAADVERDARVLATRVEGTAGGPDAGGHAATRGRVPANGRRPGRDREPGGSERRRLGGDHAARLLDPARALGGARHGRRRVRDPPLGHPRPVLVVRRGAGRVVGRGARCGAHHVPHDRARRAGASVLALPCRARRRRARRGRRRRLRAGAFGDRTGARSRARRRSPRRGRPRRARVGGHGATRGARPGRQRQRHGRAPRRPRRRAARVRRERVARTAHAAHRAAPPAREPPALRGDGRGPAQIDATRGADRRRRGRGRAVGPAGRRAARAGAGGGRRARSAWWSTSPRRRATASTSGARSPRSRASASCST